MENLNRDEPPSSRTDPPPPSPSSLSQQTTVTLNKTLLDTIDRMTTLYIDSASDQRTSAMAYYEFSQLCEKKNFAEKQRALSKGIEAARRSVKLSPDDLENRVVFISLLLAAVGGAKDRNQVIEECRDALELNVSSDQRHLTPKIINILATCKEERRKRIKSMWDSMSYHQQSFLKVAKCDLEDHFISLGDDSAVKLIREAWDFGTLLFGWEFWLCCCCDLKFNSSALLFQHFAHVHWRDLSPSVISMMYDGTLKLATAPSPNGTKDSPERDKIVIHCDSLCLLLAQSRFGAVPHSSTSYPCLDLGIGSRPYQHDINRWYQEQETRKRQGTELHQALKKVSDILSHEGAKSVGTITEQQRLTGASLAAMLIQPEDRAPTQAASDVTDETPVQAGIDVKNAIKRLSADIDSEIKKNGSWIMGIAHTAKELSLSTNPFGSYDYRDVLSRLMKTYFEALLEDLVDKADADGSDAE